MRKLQERAIRMYIKTKIALTDKRGEGALNTAITVLISVVLGALILAGLYALLENTVLPQLKQRIINMFSYNG
ncbi:DUF6133 family protein [Clostridiaceae bacterium M8S5]|nr:DUF6133 family protein [Clostridiaceae bacterium M8S5]